ncbi:E3 ubiquitin ligase TRAF3IP2 [Stigmatopora nigra]
MDFSNGFRPLQSVPVEVDERMAPSSLGLDLPPDSHQCSQMGNSRIWEQTDDINIYENRERLLQRYFQSVSKTSPPLSDPLFNPQMTDIQNGHVWLPKQEGNYPSGFKKHQNLLESSVDETHGLEQPLPLLSDTNAGYNVLNRYPAAFAPGHCIYPKQESFPEHRLCPHQRIPPFQRAGNHPGTKMHYKDVPKANNAFHPQSNASPKNVMCEVSLGYPIQADPGPGTRETRKTITLPEEYRNVFITYSVDTADEMTVFTKFLISQGFKPAIDIFDNATRRMGITRWMDRFLNDKSVLIIVAISPKYKEDVEGDGDDEHGLHTKYIHNQIQNEFIQQGCLNFRLIPVLFSNATKKHVPSWLQNTRIYRWPLDTQNLLLRLFREERYIIPQAEASLTLTISPL